MKAAESVGWGRQKSLPGPQGEASTDDSLITFSYPDTLKGRMPQTASMH